MTTTTGITSLETTYQTLIDYQIKLESAPLTQLETQQTALTAQRAVYTELKTKLDALRTATKAMISTDPFYSLKAGRSVSVTNIETGTTIISAAASKYAVAASYDIDDISLALADRVRSDEQEYSDQALSKEGTIYIGGTADRSISKNLQAVNTFGTATVAGGSTKLSAGTYYVETKQGSGGNWQFRLVNSSGVAQTISGSGTDGWQDAPASGGIYDTGRGLTIDFGTDPSKYVASSKSYGSAANVSFSGDDGSFVIADAKNTATTALQTVSDIETKSTLYAGQKELGNGTYYVETQKNINGVWQFRLVDSEGTAAKIASGTSTTNFTNGWQNIPTDGGTYDTGRGMTIDFGTDSSAYVAKSKLSGASSIDYQAKGAEVEITSDMSLNDIAYAINSGTFASGNEVIATVVNKQLVLSSKLTGASHKLQASGSVLEDLGIISGSSYKNVMQSARDATFTVNGLTVTRSQNSALTDVITGVTLNLAADAQDKSATLNIASDNTSQKTAINSFITSFNTIQSYIGTNLAVTKNADNTYTRGSLSGDQSIVSLRNSLFSLVGSSDATATVYKSLKDIGITVDSNLTMSISDTTKLENALNNNAADVVTVMDRVMTSVNSKLERYTGTGSATYIDQLIKANATKTKNVATSIVNMNARLDAREQSLITYYAQVQAQMDTLTNTQNTNSAWITSLYSSLYS